MGIENYNCKNAFLKVDKSNYIEELDLGGKSLETAIKISDIGDYENAYIILYRGLQLIGNAFLIKKYAIKSKNKNCQFQYLYEEGDLTDEELKDISEFLELRNNVYYNNVTVFSQVDEKEYNQKFEAIMKLVNKFMEEL